MRHRLPPALPLSLVPRDRGRRLAQAAGHGVRALGSRLTDPLRLLPRALWRRLSRRRRNALVLWWHSARIFFAFAPAVLPCLALGVSLGFHLVQWAHDVVLHGSPSPWVRWTLGTTPGAIFLFGWAPAMGLVMLETVVGTLSTVWRDGSDCRLSTGWRGYWLSVALQGTTALGLGLMFETVYLAGWMLPWAGGSPNERWLVWVGAVPIPLMLALLALLRSLGESIDWRDWVREAAPYGRVRRVSNQAGRRFLGEFRALVAQNLTDAGEALLVASDHQRALLVQGDLLPLLSHPDGEVRLEAVMLLGALEGA